MLVLTRKQNQTVEIDGGITVTVARIDRKRVVLGFTAPSDVVILRGELPDEREEVVKG